MADDTRKRCDKEVEQIVNALRDLCVSLQADGINPGTILSVITVEAFTLLIDKRYAQKGREDAVLMAFALLKNAIRNSDMPVDMDATHVFVAHKPPTTLQ